MLLMSIQDVLSNSFLVPQLTDGGWVRVLPVALVTTATAGPGAQHGEKAPRGRVPGREALTCRLLRNISMEPWKWKGWQLTQWPPANSVSFWLKGGVQGTCLRKTTTSQDHGKVEEVVFTAAVFGGYYMCSEGIFWEAAWGQGMRTSWRAIKPEFMAPCPTSIHPKWLVKFSQLCYSHLICRDWINLTC